MTACQLASTQTSAIAFGEFTSPIADDAQNVRVVVEVLDAQGADIGSNVSYATSGDTNWQVSVGLQPGFVPSECLVALLGNLG